MSEGARTNLNMPSGSLPYDYQSILQQTADKHRVLAGAGGSTRVLTLEDTIIPPSEQGIEGSKWGNPVLTSDPLLGGPDLSNVALWSQQLGSDFVTILTGLGAPVDTSQGGTTNISEEEAYIQLANLMHATGSDEPLSGASVTVLGSSIDISSAFKDWSKSFAADFDPISLLPTEEQVQNLANLKSMDPSAIKVSLLSMANLDSLNLDPTMRAFIEDKIGTLADTLALVNQAGGNGFLNITMGELILPLLMGALGMPSDQTLSTPQREALTGALLNISTGIADVNFKSLIQTETPSLEFITLTSGDSAKIASLLKVMCQTTNLVIDLPPETLSAIMDNLGTELAKIDPETLSTMDAATFQKTVSDAFDAALSGVSISDEMKTTLKETLLPVITTEMTNVFSAKLAGDLHSTDPATINNALTILTEVNTDPNLSPATRAVIRDYLKAMTNVLVFLAQIRATIASLEGTMTQELAKAKLSQVANQVQNAVELLKNEFTKAEKVFDKTLKDIKHANLMKWLMPFIAVIVAVIILVVIIVCIVFTVVTGGAGAPSIAGAVTIGAKLLGLCIAASVTAVTVAIAVIDMALAASKGHKGLWDRMADAANLNPAMKALLVTAIQLIADIITIVATLGIGTIGVAIKSGAQAAATVLKEVVKDLIFNMSTLVGQTIVGSLITALMSGGLIPMALAKLGEAMFGNEKDGNIFAIVMTVYMMIVMCVLTRKLGAASAPKAAGAQAGVTAASVGQTAGTATGSTMNSVAKALASALASALKGLGGTAKTDADIAAMGLKECLAYILELMKSIGKQMAGNFVESLADTAKRMAGGIKSEAGQIAGVFKGGNQVGTTFMGRLLGYLRTFSKDNLAANALETVRVATDGVKMYVSYLQYKAAKFNASFQKEMAKLESISASLQAIISMLENMKGEDATKVIEDITTGAQDQSEKWGALVQLVESMINSASAEANKLVTV